MRSVRVTTHETGTLRGTTRRPHFSLAIISVTVQLRIQVFWVISVYFNVRNILPKSGTFPSGHLVCVYIYTHTYIRVCVCTLCLSDIFACLTQVLSQFRRLIAELFSARISHVPLVLNVAATTNRMVFVVLNFNAVLGKEVRIDTPCERRKIELRRTVTMVCDSLTSGFCTLAIV